MSSPAEYCGNHRAPHHITCVNYINCIMLMYPELLFLILDVCNRQTGIWNRWSFLSTIHSSKIIYTTMVLLYLIMYLNHAVNSSAFEYNSRVWHSSPILSSPLKYHMTVTIANIKLLYRIVSCQTHPTFPVAVLEQCCHNMHHNSLW